VQEQHRLAVGAHLRLPVAEDACTFLFELVARGADVINLIADVVNSTVRVAVEELGDGRLVAKWGDQLDLGIRQRNEYGRNPVCGLGCLAMS
jgi:hypothetical protein